MDTIRFKFEGEPKDNLTWDDLEILESGKIGQSKTILARFVVDDSEKPVPFEDALKMLGQLKMGQIEGVISSFTELMSNKAINPQNAAS